jgi:hypothetical protein
MLHENLEILSVWDYYDAPIRGQARVGDTLLYYVWADDRLIEHDGRTYKVRHYNAYVLDDTAWGVLHEVRRREEDGEPPQPLAASPERQLHDALESAPSFLCFTSLSPAFASACRAES